MFETFKLDELNNACAVATAEFNKIVGKRGMSVKRYKAASYLHTFTLELRRSFLEALSSACTTADSSGLPQTVAYVSDGANGGDYRHTNAFANYLRDPFVTQVLTIIPARYFD